MSQGGHCPGNQGKVRESEKGLKWSGKSQGIREKSGSQGIQAAYSKKISPFHRFNLMISVSTEMPLSGSQENISEVRGSQGRRKSKRSGHPVSLCSKYYLQLHEPKVGILDL